MSKLGVVLTGIDAIEAVRQAVDRVEAELGQSIRASTSRIVSYSVNVASEVSRLESELRSTEMDLHHAQIRVSQMEHDKENGGAGPTMLDHQNVGVLQNKAQNLKQEISSARSRAGAYQMRVDDFTIYASKVVAHSETTCGRARDFLRRLEEHVNQYGGYHG